jgi:hypothetical protein
MIVTDWQGRHGLTAAEHQTTFNQLASLGYRLVKITGYALGGGPRFASIWYKQGGSAWQARHGISGDDYQTAITTLARAFGRLISRYFVWEHRSFSMRYGSRSKVCHGSRGTG